MLGEVRAKIQQGVKDGRCKQSSKPDDKSTSFQLISPLFQMCSQRKKDEVLNTEAVHPFWAVTKCKSAKSGHNMEIIQETFSIPHTSLKGVAKNTLITTITLPVMRNIIALEKDDVLTVQHDGDDEV
jgi:hypothetical protein